MLYSRLIERWLPIPGYEELYEVSERGRVKAISGNYKGKFRKPYTTKGYLKVSLTKDGKSHNHFVHKLVFTTFVGPIPEGFEVDHKDGKKPNNTPGNLEAITHAENMRRAGELNLFCQGKSHCHAKLTEDDVRTIRSLANDLSLNELARRFSVSKSTIQGLLHGKTWKHSA